MSSPHLRTPATPARKSGTCMCAQGGPCSSIAPGHALHLIQARLAAATPSDWVDAIVEHADADSGDLVVRTLDTGEAIPLWSGAGAADALEPGAPVALHARYDVLAVERARFNVLRG